MHVITYNLTNSKKNAEPFSLYILKLYDGFHLRIAEMLMKSLKSEYS